MPELAPLRVRRFSTDVAPAAERFDAWAAHSTYCDFVATHASECAFDADREHVAIGPFILGNRTWRHPDPSIAYEARRTSARIRADQRDFHSFSLQLSGTVALRSDDAVTIKRPGDLYLLDFARPFERVIAPGREISLSVPRDCLPDETERLHGCSLTRGIGALLGDYLISLSNAVPQLTAHDIPPIAQVMTLLIKANIHPELDTLAAVETPVRDLLRQRIQRYIDDHLLEPDLTPDRICRHVGLSRAMLYRLFGKPGGVMHEIRHRRLHQVYQVLSLPNRPHERISDIVRRHGFTDEKYFSRVFKAEFGHTPRETLERRRREQDEPQTISPTSQVN